MLPEPLDGKELCIVDESEIYEYLGSDETSKFYFAKDIKSACDFFLRYKDNPKLFEKEQFRIEPFYQKFRWYVSDESFGLVEYNEWLFRLAFADVMEANNG